jgi:mono/diheme cytochrome c family protein
MGRRPPASAAVLAMACLAAIGCRQDMHNQPRVKPLAASAFFSDGRSARPPVPGTVARGADGLRADELLYTGRVNGAPGDAYPFNITATVLLRGQERYTIFCAPCHGATGAGDGMIVQRGYRRPVPLADERLRTAPAGYFVDVMINGFGAMPDYAAQVPPRDRWAVAAYIRALQLSQRASMADVPPADRRRLDAPLPAAPVPERAR